MKTPARPSDAGVRVWLLNYAIRVSERRSEVVRGGGCLLLHSARSGDLPGRLHTRRVLSLDVVAQPGCFEGGVAVSLIEMIRRLLLRSNFL